MEQPVTDHDAALVFAGEGWHRGVVGIVASRVVERYHRPVFVLGHRQRRGARLRPQHSARFILLDALESMPELFTKFGGHRQAAGVTLAAERVDEFRERFRAYAATRLTPADFEADARDRRRDRLSRNRRPIGGRNAESRALRLRQSRRPCSSREVWKSPPRDQERQARLPAAEVAGPHTAREGLELRGTRREFAPGTRIDVAFQFEDDAYSAARGYAPWQIIMKDAKPAAAAQAAT